MDQASLIEQLNNERQLRRRAEQQLASQEQFIQHLLDALPDMLYVKDREGRYSHCNKAFAALWGLCPAELIGKQDAVLPRQQVADQLVDDGDEVRHSRNPVYGRELVHFSDGRAMHIESIRQAWRDAEGQHQGVIGIGRDVGERRVLHEELKAVRQQLVMAGKLKNELMDRVTNEIRGPLNAIIGLVHLIQQGELNPKQQQYLDGIQHSTRELLHTIGDMLVYSSLENRSLTLQHEPFTLDVMLAAVRADQQGEAEQKGLELTTEIAEETPNLVVGDVTRLRQVLHNLVANAIKFTDSGGIQVSVSAKAASNNRVRLEFVVKDTGVGMTPAQSERLFADAPTAGEDPAGRFAARGFGIAICQRIVELMGGDIRVESEYGVGSCFLVRVTLQLATERQASKPKIDHQLTGRRLMLVDADPESRRRLWNLATSCGLEVVSAGSAARAAEALAKLYVQNEAVDLILLDWKLPDSNGLEALRQLRQLPGFEGLPGLLMVTRYGREELAEQAQAAGVDGFLIKPVGDSQLCAQLQEALTTGHRSPEQPSLADALDSASELAGFRVLLAEDDMINREVAVELLRDVGIIVDTARNGREALAQLERERYDLVLMDIQMPELDGVSAARMVRLDERFKELPIIAMTVHGRDEDRAACLAVGMNDHVTKPFDPEELYRVLDHWLNHAEDPGRQIFVAPRREERPRNGLPQIPGIDLELALQLTGGNKDVLYRMFRLFRRNYAEVPAKMREDLGGRRLLSIFRAAHSLRSAARYIGAIELARLAEALETAARDGNLDSVHDSLSRFEEEFASLLRDMDSIDQSEG